jgi:hypothetical protein
MQFCLPAMRAQRAKHQWLLLLDSGTPESFRRVVEACREVQPVYIAPPHTVESVRLAVRAHAELEGCTHLLTTRLDSDDASAEDYLQTVQRHCRLGDRAEFLNVPLGYLWLEGRLYASCDLSNPFISYVEPLGPDPPQTVYRMAHMWARRVAPVRQIWTRPKWIQVLHGANDASLLDGVRRVRASTPRGFAGQAAFERIDSTSRLREFGRTLPRYVMRRWRLPKQVVAATLRPGPVEFAVAREKPN